MKTMTKVPAPALEKHCCRTEGLRKVNSLVDPVVDQQLCEDRSEEGGGDAQTEAASGPIERPPQAQGQSREC